MAIQKPIEKDFEIINPQIYLERYPLEELPPNSIIAVQRTHKTLEYNAIPFKSYNATWFNPDGTVIIKENVSEAHVQELKTLLEDYEIFTFKKHWGLSTMREVSFNRYLEAEHGIILKDYSKTLCKMLIIENEFVTDEKDLESDDTCYMYRGEIVPKN